MNSEKQATEAGIIKQARLNSPAIRDELKGYVRAVVEDAYANAFMARGSSIPDSEDWDIQVEIILDCLITQHKSIHVGEFTHAIKQGSTGMYGEVYGVNPTAVLTWVKNYRETHVYKEAARKDREQAEKGSLSYHPEMTEAEARVLTDEELLVFWEEQKKEFTKRGGVRESRLCFEALTRFNFVDITSEEFRLKCVQEAEQQVKRMRLQAQNSLFAKKMAGKYADKKGVAFRRLCRVAAITQVFIEQNKQAEN